MGEVVLVVYYGQVGVISIDYCQLFNYFFLVVLEDVLVMWQELVKIYDVNWLVLFGIFVGGGLLLVLVC